MRAIEAPCRNCTDRKLACQGKCPKYIKYKQCLADIRTKQAEDNMIQGYFNRAIRHSIEMRGNRL